MGTVERISPATVQRALGDGASAQSLGRSLYALGLPRLSLAELRRRVGESPHDPTAWRELFDFFLAENLPISAARTVHEIDARGFSACLTEHDRAFIGRWSALPPVSVYVPAFNAAATLAAVLESVLVQSVRAAQIIVVDDHSTDATAEIAGRFAGIELIRHEENRGVGAARNTALAAVQHPLVASLDADVVAGEFWLERLLVALSDAPLVGVFGALVERNAVAIPDRWRARVMPLLFPGEGDIEDAVLYGSNTLFTTAALRAVGGYDPQYTRAFDDTDLGNKLRAAGMHIRYVHRAVCEHQRRDTVQGVLRSCYAYRKETARRHHMFDRPESLELRWNTVLRDGIAELEELSRTGARGVSFITYLNIFWTVSEDLKEFLAVKDDPARRAYAGAVLEAIDRVVGEIPGLSGGVAIAVRAAIAPVRAEVHARSGGVVVDEAIVRAVLERCLGKAAVVLHLAPPVRAAIERGAGESLEPGTAATDTGGRIGVVDWGYLRGESAPEVAGSAVERATIERCRAARIEVASFDRGTVLRDQRQRETALRGYRPALIVLQLVGASAAEGACAFLQLREWCGDTPEVMVVGAAAPFDVGHGALVTNEEFPARLERWIVTGARSS